MEGLLTLGVEFLVAPLVALVAVAIELLGALISFLVQLVLWWLDRKRGGEAPRFTGRLAPAHREALRRWGGRSLRIFAGVLAVSFLAVAVVNVFFLDRVVSAITQRVEARTGIDLEYATMEGSLFTGDFRFTDVRVARTDEVATAFDLKVTGVTANLSFLDLMFGHRAFDEITLVGLRGIYVKRPSPPKPLYEWRSRGSFTVHALTITDAEVLITDRAGTAPISYPVRVTSLSARPLRSHILWFDLLFRTNLHLTVDGTEVVVENRTEGAVRHTVWSATDINAPILASIVGGPFKLFTAGHLDVIARDSWQLRDDPEINMHWALTLRDAHAAVPEGLPPFLHIPSRIFVEHVNAKTEPWELSFTATMREDQFTHAASLDAQQIWWGTVEGFLKEFASPDAAAPGTLKEASRAGLDRFKEFMRKREENAGDEPARAAEPEN